MNADRDGKGKTREPEGRLRSFTASLPRGGRCFPLRQITKRKLTFFREVLTEVCAPRTVLELGSGGGNNASHLKAQFRMTLVDRSPGMLAVSRALNPECEHVEGDCATCGWDGSSMRSSSTTR